MMKYILSALLALLILLPARAQLVFSDSVRISLLTCSSGPDAYERFGHAGIRVQDLRQKGLDVTFHYGVFSFNAPNFVYRFVKGETDYKLGADYTSNFINGYHRRGLGMEQQWLNLDSAQSQELVRRLLINYRPENRTYRYSYFFDNCSTRPFNLLNLATGGTIEYDTTWVKSVTLRQMVQAKVLRDSWLDFGIAMAVAGRSDQIASFREQIFLPEYLYEALQHAQIPVSLGEGKWMMPLVESEETLLPVRPDIAEALKTPDTVSPHALFGALLLVALLLSAFEYSARQKGGASKGLRILLNSYDSLLLLFVGVCGVIIWFLNFFSLHPAVDHNINCLWLLPTHVIMAGLLWVKRLGKFNKAYFGITFALIIIYVVADWFTGQYCPKVFLLILAILLLRSFMRSGITLTSKS